MGSLSSTQFSAVRVGVLGLTGLICLIYAVLALIWGRPDPLSPWLPGLFGVGSAAIIWISANVAGKKNTRMACDELYVQEWHRAVRTGYWFALFLYPVFAILLVLDLTNYEVAFAAMGTLTGGASLLIFAVLNLRGR